MGLNQIEALQILLKEKDSQTEVDAEVSQAIWQKENLVKALKSTDMIDSCSKEK